MKEVMHVDEFIFNYCVSSMISDDIPESSTESSAMNVFSIDENKIRDANGIIFAEAITCYKCTFCGKMFAAMEVVLTHYQSNHRCSVIPLLKGMSKISSIKPKPGPKPKYSRTLKEPFGPIPKARHNVLSESTVTNETPPLLRDSTKSVKSFYNKNNKKFKCHYPGCPKSFSYHNGLESHQKQHKRLNSYKCEFDDCKFKCSDLAGLRFHKNTHSGENPFKCVWPGCLQSFPDRSAKDEHLQKEHIKGKLLECDYVDCSAKFVSANERDRHISAIHIMRKTRKSLGHNTSKMLSRKVVSYVSGGKRGRPPKKKTVDIEEDSTSEEESESSDEEDNENNKTKQNNSQPKEDSKNDQPLDLSKTAIDLSTDNKAKDLTLNSSKEQKTDNKTVGKRGRKRKKSKDITIQKTVYRCDYPGCRKTFSDAEHLHQHEKEAHKTASADGRSRYERRCKGNLYYKL